MQRLSCHIRQVLALPVVVDDGSKVCHLDLCFLSSLICLQLLQKGTQLLSNLVEDSSLNVLIDQVESVGRMVREDAPLPPTLRAGFRIVGHEQGRQRPKADSSLPNYGERDVDCNRSPASGARASCQFYF